jgi:DNA polymerase III delta prime subunit
MDGAFHFQDFTSSELRSILEFKLKRQGLDSTDKAKDVAIEVLGRSRKRPNFGNAGEVENLLSKAKAHYQLRQSSKPASEQTYDVVFEPQDFDQEFDRGVHAVVNCRELFADVVGCEYVVAKLEGYQQIAQNMKELGQDPDDQIPTNFIFKGPPGTGKTSTGNSVNIFLIIHSLTNPNEARKMGQVFYDMGFLSQKDVIECSASDLIGQYVGQTGPKTRKMLEKGLGRVLFIDEAYRLGEGQFATEAINELVDCLTKPQFNGKLVVILAGYDVDMNKLMGANAGLSSRFPEEIIFRSMAAKNCLELLGRLLQQKKITAPVLEDYDSASYAEILRLFQQLSSLPSWGNARDIITMSKSLLRTVYKSRPCEMTVSAQDIMTCAKDLNSRLNRNSIASNFNQITKHEDNFEAQERLPRVGPSQPKTTTSTNMTVSRKSKKIASQPPQVVKNDYRDTGVSDEVWNKLQADKKAQQILEARLKEEVEIKTQQLSAFKVAEEKATRTLETFQPESEAPRLKNSEMLERKRKLEEARLAELNAQAARMEAEKALLKAQEEQKEQKRKEEKAQRMLREMGVCAAGFRWIKQNSGYRCAGGSHFVTNEQLGG